MNRIGSLFVLVFFVAIAACNKTPRTGSTKFTTSDTFVRIINSRPIELRFDVYKSKEDASNNRNVYFSCMVPGNGEYDVPVRVMDTSGTYYYDFYSADYTYTNWAMTYSNEVKFGQFGQLRFQIPGFRSSGFRRDFLRGDNISVTWKAVDFYQGFSSAWAGLTENERYKVLILHKSLNAFIYSKNIIGNIISDSSYSIYPGSFNDPVYSLNLTFEFAQNYLYNTSSPQAAFQSPLTASKDTILLQENSGYWVMVPQL